MAPPASPSPFPAPLAPMLARSGPMPADPQRWSFEIKWDGVRAIAAVGAGAVRLYSRNLRDITRSYPELAAPPSVLTDQPGTVLDGEIVTFDTTGRPSFGRLQQRMHVSDPSPALRQEVPISYVVFDLLRLDGEDLCALPYSERRARLDQLRLDDGPWRVPEVHLGQGEALLAATRRAGLEGIIAKRLDAPYRPGARNGSWLKFKHTRSQELVIGGWLPGEGRRRERIGALLMGHYAAGTFRFDGRVGTGFSEATLTQLSEELTGLTQPDPPFRPRPKLPNNAVWVRPELVAEIEYSERTRDGLMRAPSFKGLRRDKDAADVVLEAPPPDSPGQVPQTRPGATGADHDPSAADPDQPTAEPARPAHPGARNGTLRYAGRQLSISNHAKVLYPETGFTKGELIDYYAAVAPVVLEHLRGRALTLKRYPNGVQEAFFYEKNAPRHRPDWISTARVGDIDYVLAEEPASLVWLANLADIELHTSLSRADAPEQPTVLAFDLDPGPPAGLLECARVAQVIRGLFDQFGMTACVKTSGNKGLQVYVPINVPGVTYADTKPLARRIAELLEARLDGLVIAQMTRARRAGRVFVDWSQNDAHKTTVTVYSMRATARPSISTPLDWAELDAALAAEDADRLRFGPDEVLARVAAAGDLFAPVLALCQPLPALR